MLLSVHIVSHKLMWDYGHHRPLPQVTITLPISRSTAASSDHLVVVVMVVVTHHQWRWAGPSATAQAAVTMICLGRLVTNHVTYYSSSATLAEVHLIGACDRLPGIVRLPHRWSRGSSFDNKLFQII
jgi:hypothetical protein